MSLCVNESLSNRMTLTLSDNHGEDAPELDPKSFWFFVSSKRYPGASDGLFTIRHTISVNTPHNKKAISKAKNPKKVPNFLGRLCPFSSVGEFSVLLPIKDGRCNNGSPRYDHLSNVANCPVAGITPEM
ncbi:hypothetical protein LguiA_009626 [Lonicera macranthoides]